MKHLTLYLIPLALFSISFANEDLNKYLSDIKQKSFKYEYEKNEVESKKLRDSWISPLQLNFRYNKSNPYNNEQTTKNYSINFNQSVFRSGGIYYGIKYANALRDSNNLNITMQKRKLIKDTIAILMQIKQSDLKIKKQKLQIENSKIKLKQNKEAFLAGNLDSGFLDNSVITLNQTKQVLFDIQTNKEKLISKFKALSDIDYKTAYIPHLENISKEKFLNYNIVLRYYKAKALSSKYQTNVTTAKYLPVVNLTASYNRDEINNPSFAGTTVPSPPPTNYYSYGFNISLPLDINTFRDIESSKIEYLKSNLEIEDKKREVLAFYESIEENLKNIDKKIELAKENFDIYKKLYDDTKKLYDAGYKNEYDVKLLKNSKDMAKIDVEIFNIDKQLELLNLYEYYDEIQ